MARRENQLVRMLKRLIAEPRNEKGEQTRSRAPFHVISHDMPRFVASALAKETRDSRALGFNEWQWIKMPGTLGASRKLWTVLHYNFRQRRTTGTPSGFLSLPVPWRDLRAAASWWWQRCCTNEEMARTIRNSLRKMASSFKVCGSGTDCIIISWQLKLSCV